MSESKCAISLRFVQCTIGDGVLFDFSKSILDLWCAAQNIFWAWITYTLGLDRSIVVSSYPALYDVHARSFQVVHIFVVYLSENGSVISQICVAFFIGYRTDAFCRPLPKSWARISAGPEHAFPRIWPTFSLPGPLMLRIVVRPPSASRPVAVVANCCQKLCCLNR